VTETAELLCYRLVGGMRDYSAHMRQVHFDDWQTYCGCPRTEECEWRGDARGVATLSGDAVYRDLPDGERAIGKVIRMGGLRLRVLDMKFQSGMAYDAFYVALAHNPHGELQVLYRSAANWLLRKAVKTEARVRGFLLQPTEGREMKVAAWLAGRLL
jgi:hypothetical protein